MGQPLTCCTSQESASSRVPSPAPPLATTLPTASSAAFTLPSVDQRPHGVGSQAITSSLRHDGDSLVPFPGSQFRSLQTTASALSIDSQEDAAVVEVSASETTARPPIPSTIVATTVPQRAPSKGSGEVLLGRTENNDLRSTITSSAVDSSPVFFFSPDATPLHFVQFQPEDDDHNGRGTAAGGGLDDGHAPSSATKLTSRRWSGGHRGGDTKRADEGDSSGDVHSPSSSHGGKLHGSRRKAGSSSLRSSLLPHPQPRSVEAGPTRRLREEGSVMSRSSSTSSHHAASSSRDSSQMIGSRRTHKTLGFAATTANPLLAPSHVASSTAAFLEMMEEQQLKQQEEELPPKHNVDRTELNDPVLPTVDHGSATGDGTQPTTAAGAAAPFLSAHTFVSSFDLLVPSLTSRRKAEAAAAAGAAGKRNSFQGPPVPKSLFHGVVPTALLPHSGGHSSPSSILSPHHASTARLVPDSEMLQFGPPPPPPPPAPPGRGPTTLTSSKRGAVTVVVPPRLPHSTASAELNQEQKESMKKVNSSDRLPDWFHTYLPLDEVRQQQQQVGGDVHLRMMSLQQQQQQLPSDSPSRHDVADNVIAALLRLERLDSDSERIDVLAMPSPPPALAAATTVTRTHPAHHEPQQGASPQTRPNRLPEPTMFLPPSVFAQEENEGDRNRPATSPVLLPHWIPLTTEAPFCPPLATPSEGTTDPIPPKFTELRQTSSSTANPNDPNDMNLNLSNTPNVRTRGPPPPPSTLSGGNTMTPDAQKQECPSVSSAHADAARTSLPNAQTQPRSGSPASPRARSLPASPSTQPSDGAMLGAHHHTETKRPGNCTDHDANVETDSSLHHPPSPTPPPLLSLTASQRFVCPQPSPVQEALDEDATHANQNHENGDVHRGPTETHTHHTVQRPPSPRTTTVESRHNYPSRDASPSVFDRALSPSLFPNRQVEGEEQDEGDAWGTASSRSRSSRIVTFDEQAIVVLSSDEDDSSLRGSLSQRSADLLYFPVPSAAATSNAGPIESPSPRAVISPLSEDVPTSLREQQAVDGLLQMVGDRGGHHHPEDEEALMMMETESDTCSSNSFSTRSSSSSSCGSPSGSLRCLEDAQRDMVEYLVRAGAVTQRLAVL